MRDHRQHPRKPLHPPVAFQVGDGPRIDAVCRDISIGGMFVETPTPAPFGSTVMMYLTLPGMRDGVVIRSTVRWTQADGMGVQFGVMGARETYALTELLGSA